MKYECAWCGEPVDNGNKYNLYLCCKKCEARIEKEYSWQEGYEKFHENVIICPFCEHEYEPYESWEYGEGAHELKCEVCGKTFDLEVEVSTHFTTQRSLSEMPDDYCAE